MLFLPTGYHGYKNPNQRRELILDVRDAGGAGRPVVRWSLINPSAFKQTAQISSEPNQPLI